MGRLNRIVIAVLVVGTTTAAVYAQTEPRFMAANQSARITLGSIRGSVSDDRGGPLSGAMVSALGVTTAMAMTDARGRFALDALPPGEYIVRVHLPGFLSTRRDNIRVGPLPATLDRDSAPSCRAARWHVRGRRRRARVPSWQQASTRRPPRTIPTSSDDHPHSELAWRLRHLKRSVLKDSGEVVDIDATPDDANTPEASSSIFGSAFSSAASVLQQSAVLRRGQPADDVGDRVGPAALYERPPAARRRLHVDRRAGGRRAVGRARIDEPVRSVVVDPGRLVLLARRRQPRLRLRRVVQHAAVSGAHGASARARRQHGREPQGRRDLRKRSMDALGHHRDRVRRPLRALRLPDEALAAQPARRRVGRAVRREHARHGHRGAAHAGAGRRGIPGADDCRTLAAARAHVRAARRRGPARRARAVLRRRHRSRVRRGATWLASAASIRTSTIRWSRSSACPSSGGPQSPGHYYVASARRRRRRRLGRSVEHAHHRSASAARSTTR